MLNSSRTALTFQRMLLQISQPMAYGLAVLLTLATLAIRLLIGALNDEPLLELFLAPILLSAYVGGLRAGLLATALAAGLTNYFLLAPTFSISIEAGLDRIEWLSLLIAGLLISLLNEGLHRARRHAELSQRLQSITLASIGDAVITTNLEGRVSFLNATAERLTGWPLAAALGHPLGDIFQIVDAQTGLAAEDPAAKMLCSDTVAGPLRRTLLISRDGRETLIDDRGAPIKQADGTIEGLVIVFRDMTEHKRAEALLQRSAEHLQVLADASRAFAEVGTAYEALLDKVIYTTVTVLGDGGSIRLLSEDGAWLQRAMLYDRDPAKLELARSIESDAPFSLAGQSLLPAQIVQSGQAVLIPALDWQQMRAMLKPDHWEILQQIGFHSLLGVPMRASGQVMGVLTIMRYKPEQPPFNASDLSLAQDLADRAALAIRNAQLLAQLQHELAERTRAEAEVRALGVELERRVDIRTAELLAANKELEAFSYSVSHDLRAPLRAIDGYSRILLTDYNAQLPPEAQGYFERVRVNAQQMSRLIDDLLAFAQLSRQPLTRRTVDTMALVRQCLDELQPEQAGRKVEISLGDLPSCEGDPMLLRQVWLNLLANALKYTRLRNPARIEISAHNREGETIYKVQDNGVGFDMRYVDKLFGVFQRLHLAADYEGTGVGLAIVQRVVNRHGGRVWAEGRLDQGAAFFFTLEEQPAEA
jgi:PAS domain S-box-containing protein